ncbi:MAG: response regulator [Chloroflexota bacterium]|nr:MAG: response regulator [Chloroflexota bacterium]
MEKVNGHLREKILIVDDIRLHRDRAAEILARRGYATVQAENGARALDLVTSESPDLVILDAYMPDVDGMDVMQRLKADPFTHHIPVLMFTGDNSKSLQIQTLQGGADGFVHKSFDPEELVAQVEALLRRSYQFNPLTKLPAAPYLHRQINSRLAQNQMTAVLYADIDHFRPFNQLYGHLMGDQALLQLAHLLVETLPTRGAFVAHLGGDDFIAVVPPETAETFAQTLVDQFHRLRDSFYSDDDAARKYIQVEGRRGELRQVPLMTLSVALVSNERRVLTNYIQVSDLLADVMRYLKAQGGGNWARDRRTR